MSRAFVPLAAFGVALCIALPLAGCNETNGTGVTPDVSAAAAAAPATVSGANLPPGAPCSGEIGRYQAVVKDDLATGNVERKVYDQIQSEIGRAAAACAAGKGGEAHAIVSGSKAKHGYRA